MKPDPLATDASKLGDRFQILTELHHCKDSRTYLARNLELNRDVTVTVAHADGDAAFLHAYAADAKLLETTRHPNVVPVLEGLWLDERTFAAVRARVRGSTLDQAVAEGPIPQPRIAEALQELTAALIWARDNGITNRCVEPQTLVFQQGSGRVLLSFEPSPLIVSDADTIEAAARRMNGGVPLDVSQYTAQLHAPRAPAATTPAAAAASAAVAAEPVVRGEREIAVPVGSDVAVVERPNRGMSFGARVLTAFVVIAAAVVGAYLFLHRQDSGRLQATADQSASQSDAAGDVAPHDAIDTAAAYSAAYPTSQIVSPIPQQPPPNVDSIGRANEQRIAQAKEQAREQARAMAAYDSPYGSSSTVGATAFDSSMSAALRGDRTTSSTSSTSATSSAPPAGSEAAASSSLPSLQRDSLGRMKLLDPCGSPIDTDQSQCLNTAIDRADRSVNAAFQRVIAALRQQAGAVGADPDPASVEELRAAQRHWIDERAGACKSVGAGSSFYAKERAACYADRSSERKAELQRQLESIPN